MTEVCVDIPHPYPRPLHLLPFLLWLLPPSANLYLQDSGSQPVTTRKHVFLTVLGTPTYKFIFIVIL